MFKLRIIFIATVQCTRRVSAVVETLKDMFYRIPVIDLNLGFAGYITRVINRDPHGKKVWKGLNQSCQLLTPLSESDDRLSGPFKIQNQAMKTNYSISFSYSH